MQNFLWLIKLKQHLLHVMYVITGCGRNSETF